MFNGGFGLFLGIYTGPYIGSNTPGKKMKVVSFGVQAGYDISWNWRLGLEDFEMAKKSADIFDYYRIHNATETKFVVEPKLEVGPGEKFKFSYGYPFEWPLEPLSLKNIFPKFSDVTYSVTSNPNINYTIEEDLFFPVTPGIRIMDENGKTVYSEFSEKTYKADSDNHFYSFPYTSKFINKELTAQPVFKIFGREILASPSIPLSLEALPITLEANSDSDRATVYGRIDFPLEIETYESLDWNDSEIGFEYSSNPYFNENANRVVCNVGDKGTFSAVIEELQPDNTYYYRAFITTGDKTTYGDTESFTTTKPEEEIDLGLSVNWSIRNIGAELVNERGNLYSWGEIEPKNSYSWATYFDNPYSSADEWKGCAINFDISGDDRYDPSVSLEDGWRIPTREEMQELVELCEWKWDNRFGVNGYTITGPSRKSIFLPVTGLADSTSINQPDMYGAYWTSTPQKDTEGKATAATLYFYGQSLKSLQWANRYNGRAIRPVKAKK